MLFRKLVITAAAALGLSMTANAAVIVTLAEQAGNVVATSTGTLNLDGTTFLWVDGADPFLWPTGPGFGVGPTMQFGEANAYHVNFTSTAPAFGTANSFFWASSGSGVGLNFVPGDGQILLPTTFVSGDAVTGTTVWENTSFADLGAIPGTYVWTWSSDSLTLQVGPAEVATPEPSSFVVISSALTALACLRRRR